MKNRLLCYAHFDADQEVKPFVRHALRSMSRLCSTLVLVSNSSIPEAEMAELGTICQHVLVRDNIGYDFCMWKMALQQVDYRGFDEVVLMNSSIYGPVSPVQPLFEEMDKRECDFWGITECFALQPHVQSYFLVFKQQVIRSPQFATFWDSVLPYRDKWEVILSYEVGLSVWLREAGFRMDAYRNFLLSSKLLHQAGKQLKRQQDLSGRYAVQMLRSGNPFLKVSAVKKGSVTRAMIADHLAAHQYPAEYLSERSAPLSCPLCGASGKRAHRARNFLHLQDAGTYDYHKCQSRDCGIMWRQGHPHMTDLPSASVYPEFVSEPVVANAPFLARTIFTALTMAGLLKRRRRNFLRRLDRLAPGSVIEIGCSDPDRLLALKSLGWRVTGVDVAGDASGVTKLRQSGVEVLTGDDARADDLLAERFDVVLLSGMERTVDPGVLLAWSHRLLKEGGRVILSTPNVDALGRTIFGKYWVGIAAPRNAILYNRTVVKDLLLTAGFKNASVTTTSCNAELYVMHSLDVTCNKWSSLLTGPRVGRELLPVLGQLLGALLGSVLKGRGDECFAVATKMR